MSTEGGDIVVEGDRGHARVATDAAFEVERIEDAVPVDRSTDPPEADDVWRARLGPTEGETASLAYAVTVEDAKEGS